MATTTDKTLRVTAIRLQNILGLREFEVRPGSVTVIEGQNGAGKTTILEAIRAALGGGHDATLLRKGSEYGEIVLELSDGSEITKEITPDKTTAKITHPDFGELKKPRTVIDQLCDAFALNPIDFLLADKKNRLQLLLAAIPLKVNERDLAGIMPMLTIQPNMNAHALDVFSVCEKDLYDQRTGVNRVVKEKQTTAKELKKALPEGGSDKAVEQHRDAKAQQGAFLAEVDARARQINEDTDKEKARVRDVASKEIADMKAERDNLIEKIRADYQKKIDEAQSYLSRKLDEVNGQQSVSHEMLAAESRTRTTELAKTVANAEAAVQTYNRAEAARAHLQDLLNKAKEYEQKSHELTEALSDLAGIREAMLEELPIRGLTLQNGEILIDGIPFDRLNESRRVRLAVEVAMLRAGKLPLLCCDGIERLDSNSLEALEQHAQACGIQLVLARVTDSALNVVNVA